MLPVALVAVAVTVSSQTTSATPDAPQSASASFELSHPVQVDHPNVTVMAAAEQWSVPIDPAATVVALGDVLVVTGDQAVRVISADTGADLWAVPLPENPSLVTSAVVGSDDVLVVVVAGELRWWPIRGGEARSASLPAGAEVTSDGGGVLVRAGVATQRLSTSGLVAVDATGSPIAVDRDGAVTSVQADEVVTVTTADGSTTDVKLHGPAGAEVSRWVGAAPGLVAVVWAGSDGPMLALHDVTDGEPAVAVGLAERDASEARWSRSADRQTAVFGPVVIDLVTSSSAYVAGAELRAVVPGGGVWSTGQSSSRVITPVGDVLDGIGLLQAGSDHALVRDADRLVSQQMKEK